MESPTKYLMVIADLGHSSPRIPSLCKFLPHFGWQPIIITPEMDTSQRKRFLIKSDDALTIVETKSFRMQYKRRDLSLGSRILRFASRNLGKLFLGWHYQYPDAHKKWEKHVIREAQLIADKLPISLIFSSSSPVSCHIIAKKLSQRLRVPWIADLRDLWTQNHCYQFNGNRKRIERTLEVNTLSYAAALTTVTPQWRDKLRQIYKEKCFVIENGCYYKSVYAHSKNQDIFFITYTGLIYPGYQNINLVIDAVQSLIDESGSIFVPIKLAFYGQSSDQIKSIYAKAKKTLPKFISLNGYVPRAESYLAQEKADVLLLLNWEDPNEKGVATTKLYEYLASNRPILATGGFGGDYIENFLAKTKAGYYCMTTEEIKLQLKSWLEEWRTSNYIEMKRDEAVISYYSYENIAGRLVKIFEEVTS